MTAVDWPSASSDDGGRAPGDGGRSDRLPVREENRTEWWKVTPLDRRGWLVMAGAYVAMTACLTIIGLALVEWSDPSWAGDVDARPNRWLERQRTEKWTELAEFGSLWSDTLTKILLCLTLLPVCLWLFRRWHDWAFLVAGLLLEVSTFATVAAIVGRERPPVEQLDGAPTDSFPSGHIAASVVFYGGLAIVIFWHTGRRGARAVAAAIAVVVPAGVIASRLYLGMHYPSDALAGVLLGVTTLVVVRKAVARTGPVAVEPAEQPG